MNKATKERIKRNKRWRWYMQRPGLRVALGGAQSAQRALVRPVVSEPDEGMGG